MTKILSDTVALAILVKRLADADGSNFVKILPADLAAIPLNSQLVRSVKGDEIWLAVLATTETEELLLFGPPSEYEKIQSAAFNTAKTLALAINEVHGLDAARDLINRLGFKTLAEMAGNDRMCEKLREACILRLSGVAEAAPEPGSPVVWGVGNITVERQAGGDIGVFEGGGYRRSFTVLAEAISYATNLSTEVK